MAVLMVAFAAARLMRLQGIAQPKTAHCGVLEHLHVGECHARALTCGLDGVSGHAHTEACYELVLTCELEEHVHTLACFSDSTADVETEQDWLLSLPAGIVKAGQVQVAEGDDTSNPSLQSKETDATGATDVKPAADREQEETPVNSVANAPADNVANVPVDNATSVPVDNAANVPVDNAANAPVVLGENTVPSAQGRSPIKGQTLLDKQQAKLLQRLGIVEKPDKPAADASATKNKNATGQPGWSDVSGSASSAVNTPGSVAADKTSVNALLPIGALNPLGNVSTANSPGVNGGTAGTSAPNVSSGSVTDARQLAASASLTPGGNGDDLAPSVTADASADPAAAPAADAAQSSAESASAESASADAQPLSANLSPAQALVAIARSQLGYCESALNYAVRDDGTVAGYTRYGAWAQTPYASWNALFVSFCLHYAGVGEDALPRATNAAAWEAAMRGKGLFEQNDPSGALAYEPLPGDLMFVNTDQGEYLVGVVDKNDVRNSRVSVILGDFNNEVALVPVVVPSKNIVGYGRLPKELRSEEELKAAEEEVRAAREADQQPDESALQDAGVGQQPGASGSNAAENPADNPQPDAPDPATATPTKPVDDSVELGTPEGANPATVTLQAQVDGLRVTAEVELPTDEECTLQAKPVAATDEQVRQIEASQSTTLPGGITKTAHVQKESLVLLDISIVDKAGQKVEPQGEASVTVSSASAAIKDATEAAPSVPATPAVTHFAPTGAEALDATPAPNGDGVAFTTPSFSVFALAYTVDFYYEGYEYHMPGGEVIHLSALLPLLGIDANAADVADVTFSNPALVSITREQGDWLLTSTAPFSTAETLTLRMPNGDTHAIRVEDAKTYTFTFNVSDPVAGWVYANSSNADSELVAAVANDGLAQYSVRPRSANSPTNAHYHASNGYDFVGWRINGYTDFGMGETGGSVAEANLYQIRPKVGQNGVADGPQTFTATFAPTGQHLILFDHESVQIVQTDENDPSATTITVCPAGDNNNAVSGTVSQGTARSYDYLDANGTDSKHAYFGYTVAADHTGATYGALAVPDQDSKFVGWYAVDDNNDPSNDVLVCSSAQFDPTNLASGYTPTGNITVQARFATAERLAVMYDSYDMLSSNITQHVTDISLNADAEPYAENQVSGNPISEAVYENHQPFGAQAPQSYNRSSSYYFVCWRDAVQGNFISANTVLTREDIGIVAEPKTYWAEYARDTVQRILPIALDESQGIITRHTHQESSNVVNKYQNIKTLDTDGNITMGDDYFAVPRIGYEFHHWELEGQTLGDVDDTLQKDVVFDHRVDPNKQPKIYLLQAVFVPICNITYDIGVIQQVGNNPADTQAWCSVPWCPNDVSIQGKGTLTNDRLTETVPYQSTVTLPDLTHNVPATTPATEPQTIRVSKTNNNYNLLTHTFIGWRVRNINGAVYKVETGGQTTAETPVVENGDILRVGTQLKMEGSCTLEAVWDAYLPGKPGYYGTGDGNLRYNTNTCGFFVRLYDDIFDKGDTGTYTDCLFSSRIFLGGTSQFATTDLTGIRFDFYGDSDSDERTEFDAYDAYLREHANSGIDFTNTHQDIFSDNPADTAAYNRKQKFNGSTITFEQAFPSDEEMFSRIRAWNAAAPTERKLAINGRVLGQDEITTDYFDLRWYVLKDQHNSWHIDGKLILKHPKLVVKKRFEGDAEAIRHAQTDQNFFIGIDTNEKFIREYKDSTQYPTFKLKIQAPQSQQDGEAKYIDTNELSVGGAGTQSVDSADVDHHRRYYEIGYSSVNDDHTEYTWVIDTDALPLRYYEVDQNNQPIGDDNGNIVWHSDALKPFTRYSVGEQNYVCADSFTDSRGDHVSGIITTKTWRVDNPSPKQGGHLEKGEARFWLEEVVTYPKGTTLGEIQTVTFTNRYTRLDEFTLVKLDKTTNKPLPDVHFDLTIYVTHDSREYPYTLGGNTDKNGVLSFALPESFTCEGAIIPIELNAAYPFSIAEGTHKGYDALPASINGQRIGTVTRLHNGTKSAVNIVLTDPPVTDELKKVVDTRASDNAIDGTKPSNILQVWNTPQTKQLQVTKTWGDGVPVADQKPVTMQLMRNGVAVTGKTIQLGGALSGADQPPSTDAWTYTWTDLPAYVDGAEAIYSVRETWIGVPGAEGSLAYNPSDGGDGYANYTVTQTKRVLAAAEGGLQAGDISIAVTNWKDNFIRFAKVDDSGLPVAGAVFHVERVAGGETYRYGPYTSDANGIVTIPRSDVNDKFTYEIVEDTVPYGYCRGTRKYKLLKPTSTGADRGIGYFEADEEHDMSKVHRTTEIVNPVYTRRVKLFKKRGGTEQPLEGVVFSLYGSKPDPANPASVVIDDSAPLRGFARVATDASGLIDLGGLKQGTYFLVEDQPLAGYTPLAGPIRISVDGARENNSTPEPVIAYVCTVGPTHQENALAVADDAIAGASRIVVENSTGAELPSTGGAGTTAHMLAGVALLCTSLCLAVCAKERAA